MCAMPVIATSYSGPAVVMMLALYFAWPVAVLLAVAASLLFYWPRTRAAAKWCGLTGIIASLPICYGHIVLTQSPSIRSDLNFEFVWFVVWTLAPLALAAGIFVSSLVSTRRKREVADAARR